MPTTKRKERAATAPEISSGSGFACGVQPRDLAMKAGKDGSKKEWPLTLPFVADIPAPNAKRRGNTVRTWWNLPNEHVDYGEACKIGARWAAEYLDQPGGTRQCLGFIAEHMKGAEDASDNPWVSGFRVGFMSTLEDLAVLGAGAWPGGARNYVARVEAWYAMKTAERAAEKRAKDATSVARMNAAHMIKRVRGKEAANGN